MPQELPPFRIPWLDDLVAWQDKTFPSRTFGSMRYHLFREYDELEESSDPFEAADIFILAVAMSHMLGYDHHMIAWAAQLACTQELSTVHDMGALWRRIDALPLGPSSGYRGVLVNIMAFCVSYCAKSGMDVLQAAQVKFEELQTRTWAEPDHEGVVEHVREEAPDGSRT